MIDAPAGDRSRLSHRERWGLLLGVAVVAATQWRVLDRRGFWLDEGFSVGATSQLVRTLQDTGGTMALFYAALTPWRLVSHDGAWMRMLPLLFGLAALAVTYVQGRRLFGRRVALVASVVMASTHLFLRWIPELRSYSLALLLVTISWFAMLRWVVEEDGAKSSRARWVWALAGVLAVLSHGLAAVHLMTQLGAVALHPDRRRLLPRAWPGLAGPAVTAMLWLSGASAVGIQDTLSTTTLVRLWVGLTTTTYALRAALTLVLLVAAGWMAVQAWSGRRQAATWPRTAVLLWMVGPPAVVLALSPIRSYLRPPYLLATVPAIGLVVAFLVVSRRSRYAVPLALCAFALFGTAATLRNVGDLGDDWRGAVTTVAAEAQPGDVIVVPSGYRRSPFDVAWEQAGLPHGEDALATFFPPEELGRPLRFYTNPPEDLARLADQISSSGPERMFVVGQPSSSGVSFVSRLLDLPEIDDEYRTIEEWEFHEGITVVLLERRTP